MSTPEITYQNIHEWLRCARSDRISPCRAGSFSLEGNFSTVPCFSCRRVSLEGTNFTERSGTRISKPKPRLVLRVPCVSVVVGHGPT